MVNRDLRSLYFARAAWYDGLTADATDTWAAWRVLKSSEPAWWVNLLNVAFAFAEEHNLRDHYQRKLRGISLTELSASKADREFRGVLFPVWEIVNELIVARYLERVLGWTLLEHEPVGRGTRRGDWEFRARSRRRVFVEVKSIAEPDPKGTGTYSRASKSPRLRTVLRSAYQQLPDDDRATCVVLVGKEALSIPFGIPYGDLFEALFGQIQIRIPVNDFEEGEIKVGPSLRNMFVQGSKHRRLGFAAGLVYGGDVEPAVRFYGIHNPFCHARVSVDREDLRGIDQFAIDEKGFGDTTEGYSAESVWERLQASRGDT